MRAPATEGVNVLINGLGKAEDIEQERARIKAEFGVEAVCSPANVTKPDEIARIIDLAKAEFGGVDILIKQRRLQFVSPIEQFPAEKWDQILAINLSAAFHAIHEVVPVMKNAGWGRIISTASAHSLVACRPISRTSPTQAEELGPS
jgi:3-hydroxybutyrate dehydrogenase